MWNQRQVSQVTWTHSCSLCSTPCWVSRTRNQSNFWASCGSSCTPLVFSSHQPSIISSGPPCCYWCVLIPNETRGRGSITPECPEEVWCVSSQFLPKLSPHLCCPVFGTQNAEVFLCHYCIPLAHGGHIPFLLMTLQVVGSCLGEKDPPGNMLQKYSFCIHGRSLGVSFRRRGILGQRPIHSVGAFSPLFPGPGGWTEPALDFP